VLYDGHTTLSYYINTVLKNMQYKHTQIGYLFFVIIGLFAFALVFYGDCFIESLEKQVFYIIILVLLIVLAVFSTLTVQVDNKKVVIKFGVGLIWKKFNISDIKSCSMVRNRWWYGFGIRKIWGGWLYNVSGLCCGNKNEKWKNKSNRY